MSSLESLAKSSSSIKHAEPDPHSPTTSRLVYDPDEERRKKTDELMSKIDPHSILILGGASHFASHVALRLMFYKNNSITLQDSKDSHVVFLNPDMQQYEDGERITFLQNGAWDWDWLRYTLKNNSAEYDTIINCSCVSDAVYAANNPIDAMIRNGMYATQLMDVLRQYDYGGKIIHIGTDKSYGKQPKDKLPLAEDTTVCKPSGVRAGTRHAQEVMITSMANSYGLQFMAFRMGTIYGDFTPREKAIYQWVRNLLIGEPIILNGNYGKDNSPSRDWVHTYDASMAVNVAVMTDWNNNNRNEIYNIGGCLGEQQFLQNVSESIKPMLRTKTPTIHVAWRNREEEKDLHLWLDCKKAIDKLGYDPVKNLVYGVTRDTALWIAHYDLNWDARHTLDLERQLGLFDKESEKRALIEENAVRREKNLPPIPDHLLLEKGAEAILGSISRLSSQVK
jgi:nucleoside-diphosphate-sugar epimerase